MQEQTTLTNAIPEGADHRALQEDGQQLAYVVLSETERAKGFVRPLRTRYTHVKCGMNTEMGLAIAETYARSPAFYSGTFCSHCRAHFLLSEFRWTGTQEVVGS